MKFSKILEECGIADDEKARRIVNVSDTVAQITADEIENGVTIERLEAIGVPVLKYRTQITIHGKLPAFSDTARPGGYQSIFRNRNGSVGVRYVAIDGSKKQLLCEVARYSAERKWTARLSSRGLEISAFFEKEQDCRAAFAEFPRNLFAGSVIAASCVFGGFMILASVGAIYERDFWSLAGALWGVRSAAEHDAIIQKARREAEARQASAATQAAIRKAANDETRKVIAGELLTTLARMERVPRGEGTFVMVGRGAIDVPKPLLMTLRKRGPRMCFAVQTYPASAKPARFAAIAPHHWDVWDKECAAGFVFKVA